MRFEEALAAYVTPNVDWAWCAQCGAFAKLTAMWWQDQHWVCSGCASPQARPWPRRPAA